MKAKLIQEKINDINENNKIQHTSGLMNRINLLVEFLDNLGDDDMYVSAGDVMGYICGYFGDGDSPEDEIYYIHRN